MAVPRINLDALNGCYEIFGRLDHHDWIMTSINDRFVELTVNHRGSDTYTIEFHGDHKVILTHSDYAGRIVGKDTLYTRRFNRNDVVTSMREIFGNKIRIPKTK